MLLKSLVCLALLQCACTLRTYRSKIPNGDSVPYPCKPNNVWEGVGHILDEGTGVRNWFGLDFQDAGHAWTEDLCRKDSDGDGLTNGQELGDPNCTWKENSIPERKTGLSHPGICDPWDSPSCQAKPVTHPVYKTQGDWMREECKAQEFVCVAKHEPGVQNLTVHLPSDSHVPQKETTYMCQIFDLDSLITPGDYHMIAVEPVIDNVFVVHHMVLFGCTDKAEATNSTFECGMVPSSICQDLLSIWTVGLFGDCSHPSAGVRIGVNGYKRIALQVHWNNPEKISSWTDNSGLRLFYTPNRRTYDAGILLIGSNTFELPPRQASVSVKSTCTKGCTSQSFQGPIHLTKAWNHMHYAGVQMNIQLFRNDTALMFLTDDPEYSYDSPQVYSFTDNPVILLPGDEIVTTCTYTTAKLDHSVLQGEATSEEMCFGFLSYYPKENVNNRLCTTGGPDFSYCDQAQWVGRGCPNWHDFYSADVIKSSELYQGLVANCKPFTPCLQECVQFIVQATQSSACLQGDNFKFIKRKILTTTAEGRNIMALMASCPVEVYLATHPATNTLTTTPTSEGGVDAAHPVSAGGLMVILLPALVLLLGIN
ncbi:DBH-like monooxygenase protein 1 [Physella acuta]|uniref:DBH-like monooxygenase protein 1 n=1 Tax=Physella acuta TaxID=109671 RepID=UPI0027DD642F|nr:DBH-like monooxygenase protein 1 [Physella acuta]